MDSSDFNDSALDEENIDENEEAMDGQKAGVDVDEENFDYNREGVDGQKAGVDVDAINERTAQDIYIYRTCGQQKTLLIFSEDK
jgi:hypothetical protein